MLPRRGDGQHEKKRVMGGAGGEGWESKSQHKPERGILIKAVFGNKGWSLFSYHKEKCLIFNG